MLARQMMTLVVPLIVIVLAIPLILEKVPRNAFYGFRTPLTLSSDEVWYYANKISGVALLVAGIVWLVLNRLLLIKMGDSRSVYRLTGLVGLALVIAGCVASYWLTRRKYGKKAGSDS